MKVTTVEFDRTIYQGWQASSRLSAKLQHSYPLRVFDLAR
jgi:hypothetical protein